MCGGEKLRDAVGVVDNDDGGGEIFSEFWLVLRRVVGWGRDGCMRATCCRCLGGRGEMCTVAWAWG